MTNIGGREKVNVVITDTAGKEKMKGFSTTHVRGKCACIILFDLTDPTTFVVEDEKYMGVQYWHEEYSAKGGDQMVRILIGNKADLVQKRKVTKEEAEYWAE